MIVDLSRYTYQEVFYTGTNEQPDVLSFFVKEEKTAFLHVKSSANWRGYSIGRSSLTGAVRIKNSVHRIFIQLSQITFHLNDPQLYECWNAFKNFSRGIIELIPIAGNLALVIFDIFREKLILKSKIEKVIDHEKHIAGIAFDGKVVFTFDLERLKRICSKDSTPSKTSRYYAEIFTFFCMRCLEAEEKKINPLKLDEFILKFKDFIEKFDNQSITS